MVDGADDTGQEILDTETRRRLVALKWFLREAVERCRDATQLGRQVALVLLDGACERAMAHAARHIGLHVKERTAFQDVYNQIAGSDLGTEWQGGSWAGVWALHQMRNQAQHVGGVADVDQIRGWAVDAERFIHGLVRKAFGRGLDEVTLGDVVENAELRAVLADSEAALERGDAAEAFARACDAFSMARSQWDAHARGGRLYRSSVLGTGFFDDQARADVAEAADLISAFAFASEPAEYVWFRAVRSARGQGVPVDLDDPARAFSFVFTWVLRWESFNSRHDPSRAQRWQELIRPLQLDAVEGWQVLSGPVKVEHRRSDATGKVDGLQASITLRIANVDPADPEVWAEETTSAIRRQLTDADLGGGYLHVERDGVVRFQSTSLDIGMDLLVDAVRRGVAEVEDAMEAARRRFEAWQEAAPTLVAPFQKALAGIEVAGVKAFGPCSAIPHDEWPADPKAFTVEAPVATGDDLGGSQPLSIIAHNLSRSFEASVRSGSGSVQFDGKQDPNAVRHLLVAAALQVEEAKYAAERREQERAAAEEWLSAELRGSLRCNGASRLREAANGSPPPDDPAS